MLWYSLIKIKEMPNNAQRYAYERFEISNATKVRFSNLQ